MDTRPFYPLVAHSLLSSHAFYSSPSFSALFLSTKASLMHFIPGALTLDGASREENRAAAAAAAEGEAKITQKLNTVEELERKLKIATSLLV